MRGCGVVGGVMACGDSVGWCFVWSGRCRVWGGCLKVVGCVGVCSGGGPGGGL